MAGKDMVTDLHFPKAGLDRFQAFSRQRARPVANGEYARTTPVAVNVRGFEPKSNRTRGGHRSGLFKYVATIPGGSEYIIQHLNTIVTLNPGAAVQTSQQGRVVFLVSVVAGNVYTLIPGDTAWNAAVNGTDPVATPPLNITGLIRSAANGQKLYFADGVNWVYYDPATDTVKDWIASAGSLPVDVDNNAPTLIENWRGRIILSGLLKDPQNIFMSAVDDPTNFDYFPTSPSATDAIAGNVTGSYGLIGDVVTCLIPYDDDTLIIGCDHEIHILRGDPLAGGQNDLVTRAIGMAFGLPWCVDPSGTVYFFSNRCGVFSMVPGQQPQRISNGIEQILQQIDTGKNGVCMGWDDKYQGLYLFTSPLAAPGDGQNFYYDQRNQAWFQDSFADTKMNPLCCVAYDGNTANDRQLVIGSWDGYVRMFDPDAEDDDGVPIQSEVVIGPLVTKNLDDVFLKDLQAVLGEDSGTVTYEILAGPTAEAALSSDPVATGEWSAGRNLSSRIRVADHAIYIRLKSTVHWSMESIRAITTLRGKVRARGR